MISDPRKYHRRSIRLKGYDYSRAGAYFITICTYNRECIFGDVIDKKMKLNEYGEIVESQWLKTPVMRPDVRLGEFVIMPNHFHGIVVIAGNGMGKPQCGDVSPDRMDVSPYINGRGVLRDINDMGVLQDINDMGVSPHCRGVLQYAPTMNVPATNAPMNAGFKSPSKTIGAIIRGFKSAVTKQINIAREMPGFPLWQRNYYEHIIRDDESYYRISKYIINNPVKWTEDDYYEQ